ncbi:hypothetical protein R1sor_019429 [Riccia sorocarpa]|uniref:Endonuclease/exonuclease/phosphatase domain-containing protein n=1 Tax=Riccia sorocarpa TaxID=122646 RepID=A0ABD3IF73_9MARC
MPGATVVVDYALNEVGGTALVIHGSITVLERGVSGAGNLAWACIELQGHKVHVASVYGPHHLEEKMRFYNWFRELANDKEWVLVGDWNMVLSQDDSTCPSPLLKGGPLQAWEAANMRWHLEDVYNIAVKKIGPRFTRQAVRGDRLDQSRGRRKKKRKDVYTKMDIDSMRNPDRRRQIKTAWEEGWLLSTGPAIAWEMAWGRARDTFKRFYKEDLERLSNLKQQQILLRELKERIQEGASPDIIASYRIREKQVHDTEILEANIQGEEAAFGGLRKETQIAATSTNA